MATEKMELSLEELMMLLRGVSYVSSWADADVQAVDALYKKLLSAAARLTPVEGE